MEDKRKYWLWLSHSLGQGSKSAVALMRHFADPSEIYGLEADEIKEKSPETDAKILKKLVARPLDEEEEILYWCDNNSVSVLTPDCDKYPKSLLGLQDAPMVLYALGDIENIDDRMCCAVVGTRNMSDYGRDMAYKIGAGIADAGGVLVSGLALGIDGMAMAGALDAGGKSVAILGCGIDRVYPKEHEHLLKKVVENGMVITEYAPGVAPIGEHFPVRNRLISGLCQAVCVVEGNMTSGSLITARHAIYQGRPLYAVPGPVGADNSTGTNALLKGGALVATCAADILENFEFMYPLTLRSDRFVPHRPSEDVENDYSVSGRGKKKKEKSEKNEKHQKAEKKKEKASAFPPEEKKPEKKHIDIGSLTERDTKVLDYMMPDVPMLAEEIAGCGLSLPDVMVALTMLEIAGAVEAGAGGYYLKRAADSVGDPEYITEDDDGL